VRNRQAGPRHGRRHTGKEQALRSKKHEQTAARLASVAKSRYGELRRRKVRPPLDQLIQSILWRYTSVRRGIRAFRELKRVFVDWNEVRVSPVVEIAEAISAAGWATASADDVRKALRNLFESRNVVSLDFLNDLSLAQVRSFLHGLPDLSRDVADEVLLFSLGADLLPLSEDAARMCSRLGLIGTRRATLQNQKDLMELWAPELYPAIALLFVDYAHGVCRESKPRHKDCPLNSVCLKEGA
jgi:endonuclease III